MAEAPDVFRSRSAIEFLKAWIAHRKGKNPRFGVSAFARLVGSRQSTISMILQGERSLSIELAGKIAPRIGLGPREEEYLLGLIELDAAASEIQKKRIRARLGKLRPRARPRELRIDQFSRLSRWYIMALLEICALAPVAPTDFGAVARNLRISEEGVADGLNRLAEMGLLEKSAHGAFSRVPGEILIRANFSKDEVNDYHSQVLRKATDSLRATALDRRMFSSDFIPIAASDLPYVKERMNAFIDELHDLSRDTAKPDAVYGFALAFFPVHGA